MFARLKGSFTKLAANIHLKASKSWQMIPEVVMSSGNGNEHGIPVANLRLALFHLTRDVTNELEGPRISVLPSV